MVMVIKFRGMSIEELANGENGFMVIYILIMKIS